MRSPKCSKKVLSRWKRSQSREQYIRTQYPAEVKAYRQNKNRVSIALVVLIDADTGGLHERFNQLAQALSEDSQKNRQSDEAIAIFVPKRNMETWIHYLQGEPVYEEDTYSKFLKNEAFCQPYIEILADQCRSQNLPENAPESLQTACGELQELLPLLEHGFWNWAISVGTSS